MTQQKDTRITKLTLTQSVVDDCVDFVEHRQELEEQVKADLQFGGINTEISEEVIEELVERLNKLLFPNIVIVSHE